MNDVSHELGALRFVVDSPLSSKVAMFNNHVQQHKQSQSLNPFSDSNGGRASPKPTFSKDEYGKPLAGSMTEMRGQKANIHVLKEMLELCQIISSEGYQVKDEPTMRVIPFGELFNIYNYISDKVVGILLRARKHKLVEFEGEMLYQRRDDDVPIFLLRPVADIRHELENKIDDIKRAASPAPAVATSVLLDRQSGKLSVPGSQRNSRSNSPATSPTRMKKVSSKESLPPPAEVQIEITSPPVESPLATNNNSSAVAVAENKEVPPTPTPSPAVAPQEVPTNPDTKKEEPLKEEKEPSTTTTDTTPAPANIEESPKNEDKTAEPLEKSSDLETPPTKNEPKSIEESSTDLPTIVVEASAVYVRSAPTETTVEETSATAVPADTTN